MMLLEVDDMEDIVNASLGWQPQPISNRADLLNHLKWPVEAQRELRFGTVSDARCSALMETEPNPVVTWDVFM